MVITETPQQKLLYIAQQLGLKSLAGMQGTTRAVYDTKPITAGTMDFFENVGQRSFPFTNLEDNQFQVGEALAIESILIGGFNATSGDFEPYILNFVPLVVSIKVANQTVIKQLPFGREFGNRTGTNNTGNKVYLNVPLVIPPQVRFSVTVEGVGDTPPAPENVFVALYGTGVLLNLKNSL